MKAYQAVRYVLLTGALLLAAACSDSKEVTLKVLAGSELRDLEPIFEEMTKATGVTLDIQYVGTLDGVEKISQGDAADLAWFSHAKYLSLLAPNKIVQQERMMLSPVVLGVKHSKAKAWGWSAANSNVTWQDIADKAASGDLKFAMTSPSASNSGFTALMGLHAALKNSETLQGFFKGQALTAGSSGWLSDAFVQDQKTLDGMINYESVLLSLNKTQKLNEKLDLIYPKEGIVTADYPLMLLNSDKKEAYQKVVEYFKSSDVQKRIMESTLRRPANVEVPLSALFPQALLVELPFPRSTQEVQKILSDYYTKQRKPAHAIFVLDISGSMEGQRLQDLKTSLVNLSGQDTSLTGQYAGFQTREKVTLLPFNDQVQVAQTTLIQTAADKQKISQQVDQLRAGGGTGIYSALEAAYQLASREQQKDSNRSYTVVLMSDGANNAGADLGGFQQFYQKLPASARSIRTFPILFGESSDTDMNTLASLTNGKVFDGRDSLVKVFKEIRSYQ